MNRVDVVEKLDANADGFHREVKRAMVIGYLAGRAVDAAYVILQYERMRNSVNPIESLPMLENRSNQK